MTSKLDASLFAGNQGVSVKSDYGLWGTTTRKMKFRVSSACAEPLDGDQSKVRVQFEFPDMPQVSRATLVPESLSLSINCNPAVVFTTLAGSGIIPIGLWTIGSVQPFTQVCLRCPQLNQPNSFDNGAIVNGVPSGTNNNHGAYQGRSNIIMSMPTLSGHSAPEDSTDRSYQIFKEYNGNEYDCGCEINNNCFQNNTWDFELTNEFGNPFQLGDNNTADALLKSWYAEFSIVYEPEKTDFDLN